MHTNLSSKELIQTHINPLKAPIFPNTKGLIPTKTEEETKNTTAILEKLKDFFQSTRADRRTNRSQAIWIPEKRLSKIIKRVGKVSSQFGFTENGEMFLTPKESLYLLETNYLELLWNEVPFSIEQAYSVLINSKENFENYRVFKELASYGYRIKTPEILSKRSCVDQITNKNKKFKSNNKSNKTDANLFEKLKQEGPKTANLAENYTSLYNIYLPNNSIKNNHPDFEVIAKPEGSNFSLECVSNESSSTITAFSGNESVSFYQFHEVDLDNN